MTKNLNTTKKYYKNLSLYNRPVTNPVNKEFVEVLRLSLISTLLILNLVSCSSNSTATMQNMAIKAINQNLLTIQKDSPSTEFTVTRLLEELNFIKSSSQHTSIDLSQDRESGDYTASVTNSEVPESDSVSSYKYRFVFERNKNELWIITKAQESWACWPGRGHQDFSTESCF